MRRYFIILILVFIISLFGISEILIAEELEGGIKLSEGKNVINLSFEFSPIYASDLIKLNPEIETVTYNDSIEEIGYVNIFGGIGENFVIKTNTLYEITTKQEITLNLR
jgi:hypothetical protein